jgi:hypothetical protein
MSPWFVLFLLGVACAEILGRVLRHVAPRRGAPSPATALRLLHERERALTQREQEWTHWGIYVAGLARSAQLVLPPMPGAAASDAASSADGLVEGT